jgi:hypothetical protein
MLLKKYKLNIFIVAYKLLFDLEKRISKKIFVT